MKMKRNKNLCYRLLMMLAVMFFALDVSAQATINGHVKDETGEAYIYGLVDGRPGSKQSFAQMGIAPGDTLTISGRRTVYNGTTIEMAGGHLVRKANGPRHAEEWAKAQAPDQWPTFKGKGTDAFSAWVTAHLKYPKDAHRACRYPYRMRLSLQ